MSDTPYAWVMVHKSGMHKPSVFLGSMDPREVHDSGDEFEYFPLFKKPAQRTDDRRDNDRHPSRTR
jgi:hypothetical protein